MATTSPNLAFRLSATAGGGNVTITPSNSEFTVSGTAPTSVIAGGSATLNLAFTPSVAGTRNGSVSIAYTSSSGSGIYVLNLTGNGTTASNPLPIITSLSPSSVIAGADAQTLTVTGTNFIGTSVVNFNGTNRTTIYTRHEVNCEYTHRE